MYTRYFLLLLSCLLGSCTPFHQALNQPAAGLVPADYQLYTRDYPETVPWWQSFNNPELNRLISSGLQHNFSLHQAWARLSQARALARKSEAELLPSLDASAGAAHNRTGGSDQQDRGRDDFSLGLSAGYELDLWGRLHALERKAKLDVQARRADVSSAALSLSGQIAETWLELISSRRQGAQLREQLGLNQQLLELIEYRFSTAQASALDLYQQNQTIARIKGGLITAQGREQTALHQLSVLSGRPPEAAIKAQQASFPEVSPTPPGGIPADLLSQRPDIRAAGLQLRGANWSIAAARADRLPRLRLNGEFSSNAGVLESLLDSWLLRLAAGFTAPLFDGGSREAEIERARGQAEELLAAYRLSVLRAIQEVEDALVLEQQQRKTIANVEQQISLTKMAYREATWRYLNGLNDYQPVLREQINLIAAQQELIIAQRNLLLARVALHRALGGTWTDSLSPDPSMSISTARPGTPDH
ncbi:efflux transporter outer membrane subunit [Desulfogranum mediterraneum]|uniref:efflux transporter outer membrane subunit n=1 Tax=Desulfogranum mediterraneum TaxID=160661 RepID=UPI0003FD03EE|nr:efflux transporter outer membrane subunit [Desulfogranum mediterraneum]